MCLTGRGKRHKSRGAGCKGGVCILESPRLWIRVAAESQEPRDAWHREASACRSPLEGPREPGSGAGPRE